MPESGRAQGASVRPLEPAELTIPALLLGVEPGSVWPLLRACPIVERAAGTLLIAPQHGERVLYLVLAGSLDVFLDAARVTPVANMAAGQAVGEVSVIERRSATAHVVVADAARLLAIDEQTFWQLVQTSHAFAINLLSLLAQRMRSNNQQLSESVARGRLLEREANTDGLTGLLNRRWLEQSLGRFVGRHQHAQKSMSLLMLDIDHFKRFNDEYGHAIGDDVLALVAQTVGKCLRPTDLAVRYGGEELLVILPETPLEGARIAAERLRVSITALRLPGVDHAISASLGVAALAPDETPEALVERADRHLYLAKQRGRNRVES